jgi:predicted secreted acid phosphatase
MKNGNEGEVVIKPIADIFRKYRNTFDCYFVTARPDRNNNKELTAKALRDLDLAGYKELMLMSPSYKGDVLRHKFDRRNEIAKKQRIIARFGDMIWDVASLRQNNALEHIFQDDDAGICFLPGLKGELGCKLPAT